MDYVPLHKTRMGEQFFCKTMPDLVRQLERIAERLPAVQQDKKVAVDEILLATDGLIDAVEVVLDTEIVPGSEATRKAFRSLRARAQTARQAADAIR